MFKSIFGSMLRQTLGVFLVLILPLGAYSIWKTTTQEPYFMNTLGEVYEVFEVGETLKYNNKEIFVKSDQHHVSDIETMTLVITGASLRTDAINAIVAVDNRIDDFFKASDGFVHRELDFVRNGLKLKYSINNLGNLPRTELEEEGFWSFLPFDAIVLDF